MTSHSGDQIGWANQTSAIAKDELLRLDRRADSDHVKEGLTGLRRGGDEQARKIALVHLAQDGPAEAVPAAASEVELSRSTHTTAAADLTAFELSGDLLDSGTADRAISELLSILAEPKQFSERTTPTFLLEMKLVEALAGVLPAAGVLRRRAVIEHLREMAPVTDDNQLLAQAWANLLWSMPTAAWSQELAQELGVGADRHHTVLEQALLGIAARHGGDNEARKRLLREAREGSPAALGEPRGSVAVMNLWHPAVAKWDPLLELLRTEWMADSYMLRTLTALASSAERIPPSVARSLRPTIADLVSRTPLERSPFYSRADVRGPALAGAGRVGPIADRLRRQLSRSISASVRLLANEEPKPEIAKESDLSPGGNPLMNPYRREEEEPETNRLQDENPFSR